MRGSRGARRLVVAGFVAMLVAGTTAVSAVGAGASVPEKTAPARTAPASGTPVKVGLITTGGDCDGCGGEDEEAAAEAAVGWLNAKHNGLGGHPMELVTCVDSNDPGKGTDCANQMISDGVAAVVIGSNGIIETEWKILHDAGIPVINHSVTNTEILEDTESSFILYDPEAQTVTLPLAVAKRAKADKVSMVVIDVPAATEIYTDETTKLFKRNGIDLEIVPAPIGAPDLTPQAQQIVADNPDGVVAIVGHDQFCIPALNGLKAVGFTGSITTISYCITDAMRKAVDPAQIKGMRFGSEAPVGSTTDKSMKQYRAALKKYGGGDVDPEDLPALTVFQSFGALSLGTKTLQGDPTPAAVIAAMKGMGTEVLPAAGGRVFRCNGKATDFGPAICSVSTISGTLDSKGEVKKYTLENNDPIPD